MLSPQLSLWRFYDNDSIYELY